MKERFVIPLLLCIFLSGIGVGWVSSTPGDKKVVEYKYIREYYPIAWWYKGNALYWAIEGEHKPENYIKFQLDSKLEPTINQEPIRAIDVQSNSIHIMTDSYWWVLHCEGNPDDDWYVEDVRYLN